MKHKINRWLYIFYLIMILFIIFFSIWILPKINLWNNTQNTQQKDDFSGNEYSDLVWVDIWSGNSPNSWEINQSHSWNISIFEKDIINWFSISKISKTANDYPKIIIRNKLISAKLVAEIDFTDWFKNKYKYEDSNSYYFALKFFLWDFNNWWYYEVFRWTNNWVANSSKQWLYWAKLASNINWWTTREIDLSKVRIAVEWGKSTENYWYKYFYWLDYLNSNLNKEIPIWVYLSSTKEIKWRNLTYIKNLKIVYYGKQDSIDIVQ